MRAAVVVEQCWHEVPGGTASAVVDQVAAVGATGLVEQVGVAARHAQPAPEPWRPALPVRHLPLPRVALYETWHRWRRPAVERATGPVDVIHATGYAIPPRTRPLVVTMHDVAWRRDPTMFTRHGVRFFEAGLRCVVADADLVLCPSQATIDDCAAAGIDHARLRHVPWGMSWGTVGALGAATGGESAAAEADTDEVDTDDADVARVRRAHRLPGPYVLSVGTLEPRKNLPRLLEAFSLLTGDGRHADVTLAVVGPTGWGESLADAAAALGERVRLVGFVPRADLAPLYRGAAVVCYPSLWEGYGLPVAEALAAGAPVVTSSGTATEELVAGGAGLAVDPRDPVAIAGALARVLDDTALADRLRAAARRRAAETTWATTAELTIAAYEQAIGG